MEPTSAASRRGGAPSDRAGSTAGSVIRDERPLPAIFRATYRRANEESEMKKNRIRNTGPRRGIGLGIAEGAR